MSPREKNLLLIFGAAVFIILNVLAFKLFTKKRNEITANRAMAEQALEQAHIISERRDEVLDDVEWLGKHEPAPAAYQDVQSNLQQLVEREAQIAGLTIKPNSQKLLPTDQTEGNHYHRAKVQVTVTGTEKALFEAWLGRLNNPEQFRAATNLLLKPDNTDDTKIDCTAVIEQWFVPAVE
ncbi:MAG: hypothetical protein KF712_13290 [Akkermansiaceae bacterium]|nr:hypothetical protein [Akkermansiaceae bacterium]